MKPSHFILINAVAYIALGLWCTLSPWHTAELIGLSITGSKGLAEYIAVYGGLEFGLGLFFGYCYLSPDANRIGIIFALCMYAGIVLFRGLGMIFYNSPTEDMGWLLYSLEVTCLILSLSIFRRNFRNVSIQR